MDKTKEWQERLWGLAIGVVILGVLCVLGIGCISRQAVQQEIARSVIRFHVLADSDEPEDQAQKLLVKEQLMKKLRALLAESDSVAESRRILRAQLPMLCREAQEILEAQGCRDPVRAALVRTWFPKKTYGDCTFPAGVYEALQIGIGSERGQNWWCVLYPGLCFTDSLQAVIPKQGKQELLGTLSEDACEAVLNGGEVKIRFRWFS